MRKQVIDQILDALARTRRHRHDRDVGICLADELKVGLPLFVVDEVDLVENDDVRFGQLRIQQETHFLGQMDVLLLRQYHAQAHRIDQTHERQQVELARVLFLQRHVHMVQRTHTATRDVRHHDARTVIG